MKNYCFVIFTLTQIYHSSETVAENKVTVHQKPWTHIEGKSWESWMGFTLPNQLSYPPDGSFCTNWVWHGEWVKLPKIPSAKMLLLPQAGKTNS